MHSYLACFLVLLPILAIVNSARVPIKISANKEAADSKQDVKLKSKGDKHSEVFLQNQVVAKPNSGLLSNQFNKFAEAPFASMTKSDADFSDSLEENGIFGSSSSQEEDEDGEDINKRKWNRKLAWKRASQLRRGSNRLHW